ncbi:hypothetical protein B296_00006947 [Ensete ventricosum]|uniref:Uncharacterized protein n=1 Tax=Ensete ventricosum TaxID=4639 RepID=A0A427B2L4_ENSVE|nr:hypothetical protein B296_00006947 [Ensete ventricosum]
MRSHESTHVKDPRSVHGVRPAKVRPSASLVCGPMRGTKWGEDKWQRKSFSTAGGLGWGPRLRTWERTESTRVEPIRPAIVVYCGGV